MPTNTRTLCTIFVLMSIGILRAAETDAEKLKPGVLFTGIVLPTPPKQGHPWTPPASKLHEKWISAVQELLKHGFADPRGCEYREVKFSCSSSAWGTFELVTTHAWVIPQAAGAKVDEPRFAVSWDGLVYPVTEIGPAVDLKTDVEAILAQDDKWWKEANERREKEIKEHPEHAFVHRPQRFNHAQGESSLVSCESVTMLKCCMLFILGEGDLAERLWNAWERGTYLHEDSRSPAHDPYLFFTREWGWALFDRAVAAHKRGDDVVSMLDAKKLVELEQAVETVAAARGFPRPLDPGSGNHLMLFLNFGEPPSRLLEDETRRVKAGKVDRVLEVGLERFSDQSKRIAALIRDLEVASVEQWGQPGGVSISESPIVQSLIKEGQPAVEPLLDCLANDRRLTRSVGFGRDFFPRRYFISVGKAAFTALQGILQINHFGPLTEHGFQDDTSVNERFAIGEEIRVYWEKNKGRSQQEMWFRVLADNKATDRQWLEAAEKIVKLDRSKQAANMSQRDDAMAIDDDLRLLPMGESLRSKKNPTVSELLAQRADDLARMADDKNSFFNQATACNLTICLAKWDVNASVPSIHRRIAESQPFIGITAVRGNQGLETLAERLAALFEAGMQAGDEASIQGYIDWIRGISPSDFSFFNRFIFMPLWRHPDNPKLAELARWLFLAEDSPWHPLHKLKAGPASNVINSPLVAVPAFREMLKREFADTSPLGEFEVKQGNLSLRIMNTSMGYALQYKPDVELPKFDAKQTLRACDYYAWEISRLEGSPRFELYWPQPRRDAVLKDVAKFLEQWGKCFRDQSKVLESHYDPFSAVRFRLPRLSQPATAEDVAAGRAVFSFRDQPDAQVRIVPLNPYPRIARWKTLKQFPLQKPGVMEWPKDDRSTTDEKVWASLPKEPYDREGLIWQAEEVLLDGNWHRYYGFVGNHVIGKVPAEDIDLLDEFSPAHPHRW